MVTEAVLENRLYQGRLLLERQVAAGMEVLAAAWIQTAEDEKWTLYVVTNVSGKDGMGLAYRALEALAGDPLRRPVYAKVVDSKFVRPDTPLGRALIDIANRYPGPEPAHFQTLRLGDVLALEAYVYPPIVPPAAAEQAANSRELVNTVVELMSRPAPMPASRVMLQDGESFLGVPFGLELSGGKLHVKFAVEGPEPPRVYPVDAIRAIG